MLAPHPVEELQVRGPVGPGLEVPQLLVLLLQACRRFLARLKYKEEIFK